MLRVQRSRDRQHSPLSQGILWIMTLLNGGCVQGCSRFVRIRSVMFLMFSEDGVAWDYSSSIIIITIIIITTAIAITITITCFSCNSATASFRSHWSCPFQVVVSTSCSLALTALCIVYQSSLQWFCRFAVRSLALCAMSHMRSTR